MRPSSLRANDPANDPAGDPAQTVRPAAASELSDFAEAVLAVVESIPPGRVLSYGDVAELVGSRAPRAVGAVMARHGASVPWWRVIRAGGLPPTCHESEALQHYAAEGTAVRAGRVLPSAWWRGPEGDSGAGTDSLGRAFESREVNNSDATDETEGTGRDG